MRVTLISPPRVSSPLLHRFAPILEVFRWVISAVAILPRFSTAPNCFSALFLATRCSQKTGGFARAPFLLPPGHYVSSDALQIALSILKSRLPS